MAKQGVYTYEWPRPMVTVDAAVLCNFDGIYKILLIKRGNDPFKHHWALPGSFLEMEEELATCAARELQEETGLSGIALEQLHTYGKLNRDPRGRTITVVYIGTTNANNAVIKAGDDACDANWFSFEDLPKTIAFDHQRILTTAKKWLDHDKNRRS